MWQVVRSFATKVRLGGGGSPLGGGGTDSGESRPPSPKFRFLLGFRPLYFKHIGNSENFRKYLRKKSLKITISEGSSNQNFEPRGRVPPFPGSDVHGWVMVTISQPKETFRGDAVSPMYRYRPSHRACQARRAAPELFTQTCLFIVSLYTMRSQSEPLTQFAVRRFCR